MQFSVNKGWRWFGACPRRLGRPRRRRARDFVFMFILFTRQRTCNARAPILQFFTDVFLSSTLEFQPYIIPLRNDRVARIIHGSLALLGTLRHIKLRNHNSIFFVTHV